MVPHLEYLLNLRQGDAFEFTEWDDPPENRTSLEYLFHAPLHPSRAIESSAWSKRVKSCFAKWSPHKTPTPPRLLRSSFITWLRGHKGVPKEVLESAAWVPATAPLPSPLFSLACAF